jgi:hypothetical protein
MEIIMTTTQTPRHQLPYIVVGQAQKEITHNESLAKIDCLLHPVIQSILIAPPNAFNGLQTGMCWLVDVGATGQWQGKDNKIACWNGDKWHYYDAIEGMKLRNITQNVEILFKNGFWLVPGSINDAAGGAIIDIEARNALNSLLSSLRMLGIVGT